MSAIKQGYKQTKVGIIPEDWEVVKLGDLSQNGIMNGVFNDPKKVGKGLKLINVVNLYNEPFINYDDLKLLEVSEKEYKKFSALKGDLFFTRSSLKEEGIAHCNLFNIDTNDTVFECHTMRIRPNKEIVNSYYLFRYCQSTYARKILISNSKTTTMTTIDQNGLFSLVVPLPPLKEQEKIAEILTTWDEAITKQTELLRAKELLKIAFMQKLLNGEVRFGGFNNEWEEIRLGKYIKEISKKNKENVELVLSVTNKHGFIAQKDYFDKEVASKDTSNYKIVKKGNFAYNPSRINVGSLGLLEEYEIGILSPMYVIFECLKGLDSQYLNYWLNTHNFTGNLSKFLSGSVRDSLAFNDMKLMKIKLPSFPEQQKIAEVLSLADDEINLLKNELEELKLQKKALMQKLLTGQVRVRV